MNIRLFLEGNVKVTAAITHPDLVREIQRLPKIPSLDTVHMVIKKWKEHFHTRMSWYNVMRVEELLAFGYYLQNRLPAAKLYLERDEE